MDEYDDIYQLNMGDEWMNSAYDENGDDAVCDICGTDLKWNPEKRIYYCRGCGQEFSRVGYFNHIGANPPGPKCVTQCWENYPFCKKYCLEYDIPYDDPMLM